MKAGWQIRTLGEIFQIERGGSPRPIEKFITDDVNGINWIKIGDTKNVTKYISKTVEKIKPEGAKRSRVVNEGDFILSNSMSFGRPYIMKTTGCIHDGWLVLREKMSDIDKDFFYHLIGSDFVYAQFDSLASGSTVRNLNIELVKKVNVPFPPLPEQQRIVTILDEAFEGIAKATANAKKNLANARELFESNLQSVFNQRGEGWKVRGLGEVCEVKDGTHDSPSYVNEGIPFVTQKNIRENGLSFANTKFINQEDHSKFYKRSNVAHGDILISMIGANRGMVSIVDDERIFSIKNVGLVKKNESVNQHFLLYFLKSSQAQEYVRSYSKGGAQEFIGLTELRKFPIPLPSIGYQNALVLEFNALSQATKKLEAIYQQKLTALDELKKSILNQAFSGQLN